MCFEYDYSKLRGKIAEIFGNQRNFAKAIDAPESYVSKVLNGLANPTQDSIREWADSLGIEAKDIGEYFFTLRVVEKQQE